MFPRSYCQLMVIHCVDGDILLELTQKFEPLYSDIDGFFPLSVDLYSEVRGEVSHLMIPQ